MRELAANSGSMSPRAIHLDFNGRFTDVIHSRHEF